MITVGVAVDEAMEAVENRLAGDDAKTEQTPERVLARLSVVLEMGAKGRLPDVATEVAMALKDVPPEVLSAVARSLLARPLPGAASDSNPLPGAASDSSPLPGAANESSTLLAGLIPGMPEPARAIFAQARDEAGGST